MRRVNQGENNARRWGGETGTSFCDENADDIDTELVIPGNSLEDGGDDHGQRL